MRATMEPIAWVLRLHNGDDAALGDPYCGSCTVTVDEFGIATLRGLTVRQDFDSPTWRAIEAAFVIAGIKGAVYSRRKLRVMQGPVRGNADHDG